MTNSYNKPTRWTTSQIYFWIKTLYVLESEQDQDGTEFRPDPVRKLSTNLYDIYTIAVRTVKKLLMVDRGTVRNM